VSYDEIEDPADFRSRVRASLLAGAIGDAPGAPIEFMSLREVREQFVPAYGRAAGGVDYVSTTATA